MTDIRETLIQGAKSMGWKMTPAQAEQFQAYMELLLDWNEKINLTSITEPEQVVEKHFLDSLTLLDWKNLKQGAKVIDVGTGAGFPGIPLKIMRPDIELTLLDGTQKRLNFLGEVCRGLKLQAHLVHKRAEEAGRDKTMRERFDLATARAVAALPTLAEYCMPLVWTSWAAANRRCSLGHCPGERSGIWWSAGNCGLPPGTTLVTGEPLQSTHCKEESPWI